MARGGSQSKSKKAIEKEARRLAVKRAQTRRRAIIFGIAGIIVAVVVVFAVTRPEPQELAGVVTFADQGQAHVDAGDAAFEYNSNPPTSGPHGTQSAPCGVYRQGVPDLNQIHNLEHGTVIIQYATELADSDRTALEDYAREVGTHILVAPRDGLDDVIALTAWTKLLPLESVDEAAIRAFYDRYSQKGPERGVACPMQADEAIGS